MKILADVRSLIRFAFMCIVLGLLIGLAISCSAARSADASEAVGLSTVVHLVDIGTSAQKL